MSQTKRFYLLVLLFLIAILLGGVNFFQIKKMNQALQTQQEQMGQIPDLVKSMIEQKELMNALDSVKPEKGAVAPNFSFKDQYGNNISLESLKTEKALLVFSSAQCPSCKEFYPHLQQFVKVQKKIDVAVIQIDADKETNLEMLKKNGYDFALLEGNVAIFDQYKVISTPTSVLIDTTTKTILKSGDLMTLEEIHEFIRN